MKPALLALPFGLALAALPVPAMLKRLGQPRLGRASAFAMQDAIDGRLRMRQQADFRAGEDDACAPRAAVGLTPDQYRRLHGTGAVG